ncbi:MAG: hypothetical protein HZB16_00955 [Armatimonadetes bacterium]|nr:hypothetical protein [Armatimonadota bacterium]
MRRMARVVMMLLVGAWPIVASAGPFETLPRGHRVYADLAAVDHEGLLSAGSAYQPGRALTRTECAMIVNETCKSLTARAGALPTTANSDPRLAQVVSALLRLIDVFAPELKLLSDEMPMVRERIAALPTTVSSLAQLRPDRPAPHGAGGLSVAQPRTPWMPRLADSVSPMAPTSVDRTPASGLSMSYQPIVARDPMGPSSLLSGQVFAADLRLRMGDTSVLIEYGRSLFDQRLGAAVTPEEGARLRTSFETALTDRLSLDLGYNRLSGNYRLFTALTPGLGDGALSGLQAGVSWAGRRWHLFGGATVLAPEHELNSFYNIVGGQVTYNPTASWSVAFGYQSNMRRSLASFEDTWRSFYNAKVAYALNQALRADLLYRFDTGEQRGNGLTPGSGEHFGGVSLSVGF